MSELEKTFDGSMLFDESQPSKEEIENFILNFEKFALSLPQLDIPIKEYFSNGVYGREMSVPKGAIIAGKMYKDKNLNILSKGKIILLSSMGKQEVEAPFAQVFDSGKKMFFAKEDFVWTTIFGTDKTNFEDIEDEFLVKEISQIEAIEEGELCQQ